MAIVPVDSSPKLSLRNRLFLRRVQESERPGPRRALTASASALDLTNKTEARKLRVLRQGWQSDAAAYVKAVPELSFAYRFLANASSRMRLFPALVNPEEPDGPPIPVDEHPNAPQELKDSMHQAMMSLGVGRLALAPMQESLSYSFGVPGECFLVGQNDGSEGGAWKIRSIEEFMVFDDQYKLREVPLDPQGILGWIDLDPETTYAARMWIPDFMYSKMATSPMRALLDTAEELLLLSRDVRAVARSRLAGGGILKIPEGLRMLSMVIDEDNEDPESEDFFGRMAETMMAPLADEGTASAVVPIGISGTPDDLRELDHLLIDRPYSALAIELRAEAIGRLATGLDFPREILEGIGDVNHWSGALVSDENFRHHIEPQVIKQVDALTVAFMRSWLSAAGFPAFWVNRACIWYDPTDLVSKPDPMANAVPLFDRFAISYKSLREAGGYTEDDAPKTLEFYARQLAHIRTFPPNVLEAIIHAVDPSLEIPPIEGSGQVPGMGPKGAIQPVDIETQTGLGPEAKTPGPPSPAPTPPVPEAKPSPAEPSPPAPTGIGGPSTGPKTSTTPAAQSDAVALAVRQAGDRAARLRLSRRLSEIDSHLRSRIQTAAAAAMLRMLDKAGARLRTRVADRKFRDTDAKALVERTDNRHVPSVLGPTIVAALGFGDPHALLNPDWGDLRSQFVSWTRAAQTDAIRVARQLAGLSPDDRRVTTALDRLEAGIGPAWTHLEGELNRIAESLLYHPDPNDDGEITVNPNTVVPAGVVRAALTIAGGATPKSLKPLTAAGNPGDAEDVTVEQPPPGDNPPGNMVGVVIPDGQIGNGGAIGDMLGAADMQVVSYTWEHLGVSDNPFEPHLDLDGQDFTSFDDDVLANNEGWPPVDFFLPGDHDGCGCDYTTEWAPVADTTPGEGDGGDGEDTGFVGPGSGFLANALDALVQNPWDPGQNFLVDAITQPFTRALDAQSELLDDAQKAAYDGYKGSKFEQINGYLRGDVTDPRPADMPRSTSGYVKQLDSIFQTAETRSESDMTVFRGLKGVKPADLGWTPGTNVQENSYLSTSVSRDIANGFGGRGTGTVLQITVPKDTPFILGEPNEAELIFPRGTSMVVDRVEGNTVFVHMVVGSDVVDTTAVVEVMAEYPTGMSVKDIGSFLTQNWPTSDKIDVEARFSVGGLKPDVADEVGKTLRDLAVAYPDVASELRFFGGALSDLPSGAARMPNGSIAYSTHFIRGDNAGAGLIRFSSTKLNARDLLARDASTGFTAVGTPEGVISHEFGHQWADSIKAEYGAAERNQIIDRYVKDFAEAEGIDTSTGLRYRYDVVRANLSRYATTNYEELLAEAFSEVWSKGDQARPFAKGLIELLEGTFRGGK